MTKFKKLVVEKKFKKCLRCDTWVEIPKKRFLCNKCRDANFKAPSCMDRGRYASHVSGEIETFLQNRNNIREVYYG
jgi:hypothetical protein